VPDFSDWRVTAIMVPGFNDWHMTAVVRLLMAGLCGAVIGFEREIHEKDAGLRTHILMSLGSCLFALIGLKMSEQFVRGDPLRLLQGLLLGVGFLAGGVIFTHRGSVHGLTTAAGLWVMAGVGMAAGLGYFFLAAVATVFTVAIVAWLKRIEVRIHPRPSPSDSGSSKPGSDDSKGPESG